MTYFAKFPALVYDLDFPSGKKFANPVIVTDIFKRIAIKKNLANVSTLFTSYSVKDEDTAEIIAHKLYGSASLHWLVFLANTGIINPFFDWPLSERKFVRFVAKKYPGTAFFMDPLQIVGSFREGLTVTNATGSALGTVSKVDTTLSKLVVQNTAGVFAEGDTLVQDVGELTPVTADLTRLVAKNRDALNHFEDAEGNILNPLTFRDGYIQGGFGFPGVVEVFTNIDTERKANELKRQIRLIDPEHVSDLLRDLEIIFRRNLNRRTT